jgi:hypothetical protein
MRRRKTRRTINFAFAVGDVFEVAAAFEAEVEVASDLDVKSAWDAAVCAGQKMDQK